MKLATYNDGSRDGQLIVVSRDLRLAHYATGIASRMQQVLDDWAFMAPQLQDLYQQLNQGRAPHAFAFDASQCMAPLPRTSQWVEAQAYEPHVAQVYPQLANRRSPWMRQGAGDSLVGACDEVVVPSAAMGMDFGAGWAAITGDVPMGASAQQAAYGIRLLMLCDTISLRQLQADAQMGPWQLQSWAATACSPVAVTVDELGAAWQGARMALPLHCSFNGRKVGMCDAAEDMAWDMGELIAHVAATRSLQAGAVVGSGVVANAAIQQGKKEPQWPKGFASLADRRAMEVAQQGEASTPYLQFGDSVRVEVKLPDGQSLFGAIDHTVVSPQGDGSEHDGSTST